MAVLLFRALRSCECILFKGADEYGCLAVLAFSSAMSYVGIKVLGAKVQGSIFSYDAVSVWVHALQWRYVECVYRT